MHFDHIIGNDSVKALLSHSISTNNILHSYMFIGPDGIGKSLFAKEFSKMILCNSQDLDLKPCEKCDSCIQFSSQNHPDFLFIDSEDGKSIKIEQIRFLQERIAEKPITSNKKVYIINDCDTMTREAQNCLLKTLEEPPNYSIIILISSNENKLLNTIKSRCTKITFNSLTDDMIIKYFSTHNIAFDETNSSMLKLCGGSIGKALLMQSEEINYEQINTIFNSIETDNIIDIWNASDILYKSKDIIINLLEYINIIFMDKFTTTKDIRYANCIQIIEQCKKKLSNNANYDMCIDEFLLKIWEEFHEKYNWS